MLATSRLQQLALWIQEYHSAGMRVFPCLPRDKPPALPWKDFTNAPQSLAVVAYFNAQSNLGIATGWNGLYVVDFDNMELATAYFNDYPDLAETMRVSTSAGMHFYYQSRDPLPNGKFKYKGVPGGDIRGMGGYVLAPPSVHPDGSQYLHNTFGFGVLPMELSELPIETKHKEPETKQKDFMLLTGRAPGNRQEDYANKVMEKCLLELAGAPVGDRNNTLNKASFVMGMFSHSLDSQQAIGALEATALAIGLEETETRKTIASGWGNGSQKPAYLEQDVLPQLPAFFYSDLIDLERLLDFDI